MRPLFLLLIAGLCGLFAADGPAPSAKRGICYNRLSPADAALLSHGVSWCYNWYHKADGFLLAEDAPLDWYPMVWGAEQERLDGLAALLAGGFRPDFILSLNEPNLRGQAFISPEQMAAWQSKVEALGKRYGIPVVGPHMALGSSEHASITAHDPIEGKQVTYTYMVPYLNAYYHFLGGKDGQRAVAVHSYGTIEELRWMIGMLEETYGLPIWVTEFAWWGAQDMDQQIDYAIQAVALFEATPSVEKYAWFKTRMGEDNRMSLLEEGRPELTRLGEIYLAMPAPGQGHVWKLPARIEAERHEAQQGLSVKPSADETGVIDMQFDDADDQLSVLVEVERKQTFTVRCRATGNGRLILRSGGKVLAGFDVAQGYADIEQRVTLPKGKLRLQLVLESGLARVNHISFDER